MADNETAPNETTDATSADSGVETQPPPEAAPESSSTGAASAPETPENGQSDQPEAGVDYAALGLEFRDLIARDRERQTKLDTAPVTEHKPASPLAKSAKDAAEAFVAKFGDEAKPLADLMAQMAERLDKAEGRFGEFDPLKADYSQRQEAKRAEVAQLIHTTMDKFAAEGHVARYGASPDKATSAQLRARGEVVVAADGIQQLWRNSGKHISDENALALAHRMATGEPDKSAATDAVRQQVVKGARRLSVPPGGGGQTRKGGEGGAPDWGDYEKGRKEAIARAEARQREFQAAQGG